MSSIVLENMTERELLVQQAGTLAKLCTTITKLEGDNKSEHNSITEKVDGLVYKKVSYRLFFWLSGIIILCLMSLTAYTGITKNEVVKNTTCIEKLEDKVYK